MTVTTNTATIIRGSGQGLATNGSISLPGLNVGDVLFQVEPAGFIQGFEQVVSAENELQQTTTLDWSSVDFTFYLLRGV